MLLGLRLRSACARALLKEPVATSRPPSDEGGLLFVAPLSPGAVVRASRPHLRGQDALAPAGKMPALPPRP